MSAPERIWANCDTPDARLKSGRWHQSPYGTMYILATPEALAASPEVQAKIEEARRETIQMCQDAVQKLRREAAATANGVRFQALDDARDAIRNAALKKGE